MVSNRISMLKPCYCIRHVAKIDHVFSNRCLVFLWACHANLTYIQSIFHSIQIDVILVCHGQMWSKYWQQTHHLINSIDCCFRYLMSVFISVEITFVTECIYIWHYLEIRLKMRNIKWVKEWHFSHYLCIDQILCIYPSSLILIYRSFIP
jgi:hypothetical protein